MTESEEICWNIFFLKKKMNMKIRVVQNTRKTSVRQSKEKRLKRKVQNKGCNGSINLIIRKLTCTQRVVDRKRHACIRSQPNIPP